MENLGEQRDFSLGLSMWPSDREQKIALLQWSSIAVPKNVGQYEVLLKEHKETAENVINALYMIYILGRWQLENSILNKHTKEEAFLSSKTSFLPS